MITYAFNIQVSIFFITEIVYNVDFLAIYKKLLQYLNAAWSDLISNFMYNFK